MSVSTLLLMAHLQCPGPCCATFMVTAEKVREYPLSFWVKMQHWFKHTEALAEGDRQDGWHSHFWTCAHACLKIKYQSVEPHPSKMSWATSGRAPAFLSFCRRRVASRVQAQCSGATLALRLVAQFRTANCLIGLPTCEHAQANAIIIEAESLSVTGSLAAAFLPFVHMPSVPRYCQILSIWLTPTLHSRKQRAAAV
jgi:hypothetical protein